MSDLLFEIKDQGGEKLKKLREQTGLDQASFAELLGISQSRVSKLENLKAEEAMKAGFDILVSWCETAETHKKGVAIDFEGQDPRSEVNFRINTIEQLIKNNFPEEKCAGSSRILKQEFAERSLALVKNASRKPIMGFVGNFDQGKSSVINSLTSLQAMPERMSPTSRLCTLSRDISDRPVWHPEDGSCYKDKVDGLAFNFSLIDDKSQHEKFKVVSGDKNTIRNVSDHDYSDSVEHFDEARHAVLYVNSSLTRAVDIIDTPGFDNDDLDDETATLSSIKPDITVFCSLAAGFMSVGEIQRFRMALLNTRTDQKLNNPLDNVFILMTNAASAGGRNSTVEESIELISQKAAERIYSAIKPDFEQIINLHNEVRGDASCCNQITIEDIRSRIFTFSLERPDLCEEFTNELSMMLRDWYPRRAVEEFDKVLLEDINGTQNYIDSYQQTIANRAEAKETLERLRAVNPEREEALVKEREKVKEAVVFAKKQTRSQVSDSIDAFVTLDNLEGLVNNNFSDKDAAKEALPTLTTSLIEKRISYILTPFSEQIAKQVNQYIANYDGVFKIDGRKQTASGFDASAAMLGGIAGLGSVGALALWASIITAGSNLGGYIAVAKVASFLSAIGISISSGTLISVVATTGGPITWAIGAGILIGGLAFSLFRNWRKAIAKDMHKKLSEPTFKNRILEKIEQYWDDTSNAIQVGFDNIEFEFQEEITNLETLVNDISDDDLAKISEQARAVSDFYVGIRTTIEQWR